MNERPADTLLYLDAESVRRAMPPPDQLVDLAELALRSLVAGAQVPERASLDPVDGGIFAQAMPARLSAIDVPGGGPRADLMGLKWIAGGPGNRALGLPAMTALVVINDPTTGVPVAILDGATITAARTAALSGVAVRLLIGHGSRRPGPAPTTDVPRAVLVGAGAQGRAHAEMLGAVLPGVEVAIHDRHPDRADGLAREARTIRGLAAVEAVTDPMPALARADVVVTATALGGQPVLGPDDVAIDALVIPVDYAAYVRRELVAAATTFAVDDRGRFEANRRNGRLPGWPDPTAVLGELLLGGSAPRLPGLAVALHQGPGIADVIVADAVLRSARVAGLGMELPR